MQALRLLHRIPAHVINGVTVALGIGLVHGLVAAWPGPVAALSASSGAVFASLADLPNPPHRSWRRVAPAAAMGCAATLLVLLLRPFPLALGLGVGLIGFASAMTLAWGVRAGPISFVGVLAFVFTMARPPPGDAAGLLIQLGWTALGAGLYLGWTMLTTRLLLPRFRTLALAEALSANAQLLHSRAEVLASSPLRPDQPARLQAWIEQEGTLGDRVQGARDLLFAAPETPASTRQSALLVLLIDLRDTLLLGELDLELLGGDAAGVRVRSALAASLRTIAGALDAMADALRLAQPVPVPAATADDGLLRALREQVLPEHDPRRRLLPVLEWRVAHMLGDLARMRALLQGERAWLPIEHAELQLFVSGEGWPLAALRPHANLQSPVLRHALRTGMALACAWYIGLALPWASHAYWLVLSVAVVLRGSLDQTLARRNERVAGTAIGCLLVLGLAQIGAPWLAGAVFLVAVGTAHAYVARRYAVTAVAGTVMALLQVQLAHSLDGLAIAERLADTVLGALLAWAFSYMLPSWERDHLPRLVARLMRALAALSEQALRIGPVPSTDLDLRLARREVYESLGGLAAASQRAQAEPQRVRVPARAFALLLAHSDALVAHLAAIKLTLARRPPDFDDAQAQAALHAACAQLERWLAGQSMPDTDPASLQNDDGFLPLPAQAPADTLLPWLTRRLRMATREAARVARAAAALRATA